jgi:hypothetical protein
MVKGFYIFESWFLLFARHPRTLLSGIWFSNFLAIYLLLLYPFFIMLAAALLAASATAKCAVGFLFPAGGIGNIMRKTLSPPDNHMQLPYSS